MDKYASTSSDYCSKINKVVVNDKEYPVYDEEGKDNYYSMTYSDGFCVYMGLIKDGENTIIVSANGYKDKKIIVNVDKTAKTVTFVSQEDLGSGDAVIDKNALNNMITAAKAYTKESASDENGMHSRKRSKQQKMYIIKNLQLRIRSIRQLLH